MKLIVLGVIALHVVAGLILDRRLNSDLDSPGITQTSKLSKSVVDRLNSLDPRKLLLKLMAYKPPKQKVQRSIKQAIEKIGKKNLMEADLQGAMINNIEKSFAKSQKISAKNYKKTFKRIQRLLGKKGFQDWKRKLEKSGITVSKLPLNSLDEFVKVFRKQKRKAPRKLTIGMNNADHTALNYDIKSMSGGSLSVRFPDLPRAVVVNQTPYYQYT